MKMVVLKVFDLWNSYVQFRVFIYFTFIYNLHYFSYNGFLLTIFISIIFNSINNEILKSKKIELNKQYLFKSNKIELIKLLTPYLPKHMILGGDYEQAIWFQNVLNIWWPYLNHRISDDIIWGTSQLLTNNKPSFLSTLEFSKFDFGENPLIFKSLRVLPKTQTPNQVFLDIEFDYESINSCISIKLITKTNIEINIELINIKIKGDIRVIFSELLDTWWPIYNEQRITFLNKPFIDYDIKINNIIITYIPGLKYLLNNKILNILANNIIFPYEYSINFWDLNDPSIQTDGIQHPIGMLKCNIIEAVFNLKKDRQVHLWLLPYKNPIKFKTLKKKKTKNPIWNEIFNLYVKDLNKDKLHILIEEINLMKKNELICEFDIEIQNLEENLPKVQWFNISKDNTDEQIKIEITYFPFILSSYRRSYNGKSLDD